MRNSIVNDCQVVVANGVLYYGGPNSIFSFNIQTGQRLAEWRCEEILAPRGLAVDKARNIYVTVVNQVLQFSSKGDLIKVFTVRPEFEGGLHSPRGIAINSEGDLYIADGKNRLVKFAILMRVIMAIRA